MKRVSVLAVAVLVALAVSALSPATASADETKWVRGKVTAMDASSITVSVRGKDMKFAVDKETDVVARGAGTAMKEAQAAGAPGVKLGDVVKVGEGVEVHYHEMGAMLHAAEIRGGVSVGAGATSEDQGKSVRGTVTSVSADMLKLKSGDKEMTFTVDAKTTVVGRGAGTIAREKKAQGAGPTISDLVGVNDYVTITYHEMGTTLHAGEIRVSRKAGKT